jgi:Helix-turn-helix domain
MPPSGSPFPARPSTGLIDRGELRAIHVGRVVRIDPDDLDRYLNREASQ